MSALTAVAGDGDRDRDGDGGDGGDGGPDRVTLGIGRGRVVQAVVARFGVRRLLPDPGRTAAGGAELVVMDGAGGRDHRHLVPLGGTFPVRDQVWRLESVTLEGDGGYHVTITRLDLP